MAGVKSRGRGIYFSDEDYADLLEEISLLSYETRRPISRSEFVREATMEKIAKNRALRAQGKLGKIGDSQ